MKPRPNHSQPGRKPAKVNPPAEPAPPMSPRRKWLFRLSAAVLLPLFLLGGLEVTLRLAGFGYATRFFEKVLVGGKAFWVNNEDFSLRFFPPQLARWPGPVMFAAKKPADTYRIFVLGESAARGEPEPSYAASRYLQTLLEERFPNTRFEVINLGITAINSHVILPIARDCAKAEGDLWIIYLGNNEMVGPFGAATVFGAKALPLEVVRLNLAIQQTRLGQLLVALSRHLRGQNDHASWGGMDMFVGNELRAEDPRKTTVYGNFERNLQDIVRIGLNSGAKILLNTVAVNLKDCAPFASLTNSNLPAAERAEFDRLFAAACGEQAQSNFAGAAQNFALAAKRDPQFPELQFRWAGCLQALTNLAGAREHWQLACDDDALPFRADSRINAAIVKTGRQFAGEPLVVFDAAAELAKALPDGVCGRETFFEHVHFTFDGQFALGRAWAEQVAKLLPAASRQTAPTNVWSSQAACDRALGLTDWNRCAVTERMLTFCATRPLSDQSNNAERRQRLRDEVTRLRQQMNPATAQTAATVYQAAINQAPQDFLVRENFAEFLESAGDLKSAAAQWQEVGQLIPHSCEPFYHAGRLLSLLDQWDAAQTALLQAVALRPRLPEAWYELGNVQLGTGKFAAALQDYNRARELDPASGTYCAFAGKALAELNRHAEAVQLYRQATALQPDLMAAHFGLGDELAAASQFAEAEAEYAQVIRLQPALPMAHLDRGVMLARLGRFEAAIEEFQTTLRLDPGNAQARQYLDRVTGWQNQRR
jgi:tetratricopeptide (TPR) repeat protein